MLDGPSTGANIGVIAGAAVGGLVFLFACYKGIKYVKNKKSNSVEAPALQRSDSEILRQQEQDEKLERMRLKQEKEEEDRGNFMLQRHQQI